VAATIYNSLPNVHGKAPVEKLTGNKADLDNFKVFGCKVVYFVPKQKRLSKAFPGRQVPGRIVVYQDFVNDGEDEDYAWIPIQDTDEHAIPQNPVSHESISHQNSSNSDLPSHSYETEITAEDNSDDDSFASAQSGKASENWNLI
jgi:hypothetical protein